MKLLFTNAVLLILTFCAQAQTWTKVSGTLDSSQVKGVAVINNQILVAGQNWINNSQTDYAYSSDGGITWSKLPTYNFAGFLPNKLSQNNLFVCSNGFTASYRLVGSNWQFFSGANNFAEFTNGSIIGSMGSFPDTVYNFSANGVKGSKLGDYTFKLGHKYCNGANNRLFVFAYGVGLGYIDYSNLRVVNFPATLDGNAMTQTSWDLKVITDMIQTSNGNLFAIGDGVFKSVDNGENWSTVLSLSGTPVTSIAKNSFDDLYIIAGNAEIRKSTDLGTSFTDESGNLPNTSIGAFKKEVFVNTNNEVFVIINKNGGAITGLNSGIFKLNSTTGISNSNKNSLLFDLYPNPSNENFYIDYEGFDNSPASLIITNTVGQIVLLKNLVDKRTRINSDAYPAGIYFVTIKSENRLSTKRLVVN